MEEVQGLRTLLGAPFCSLVLCDGLGLKEEPLFELEEGKSAVRG